MDNNVLFLLYEFLYEKLKKNVFQIFYYKFHI